MNEKNHESELSELCRKATEGLRRAHDLPRESMQEELHRTALLLFDLRDRLIEMVRKDTIQSESSPWRHPLDLANQAATLVAGVEYPSAGINRNYMKEARQIMEGIQKGLP